MVDAKRKRGESFESFLRRFNKTLLKSTKLKEARKRQYVPQKINKNKQKLRALVGLKLKKKREYLQKIGKWEEEINNRR